MKASKIFRTIENEAPISLAESWDNPGLQIGARSKDVDKVLLTLDVTEETLKEAKNKNANLIVSHHPFFFNGAKRIDLDDYKGGLISDLIKNNIMVYSAHTNLDKSPNGINQYLAELLGLKDIKPLVPEKDKHPFYKLVIYIPEDYLDQVEEELFKFDVGKGASTKYTHCTFQTSGLGSFEPNKKASPAIGIQGQLERVPEVKLETIICGSEIRSVIEAIRKVHPYEEMAYDLFPVEVLESKPNKGLGRIGKLAEPMKPEDFIQFVKDKLKLDYLREAGKIPKLVRKVALCSGAGSEFIGIAKRKGADVLITGDLKHHDGQRAEEMRLWVLDAGHYGTEKQIMDVFKQILEPLSDEVEIITSKSSQDYIHLV